MELYLNVAEWGDGIFGIEAAARKHYGKSAAALGPHEAAVLASVLPNPIKYKPNGSSKYVAYRSARIYQIMVRRGIVIPEYEEMISEADESEEETEEQVGENVPEATEQASESIQPAEEQKEETVPEEQKASHVLPETENKPNPWGKSVLQYFDSRGHGNAAAAAECRKTQRLAVLLHGVNQCNNDPATCGADRMAQSDAAAVDIGNFTV